MVNKSYNNKIKSLMLFVCSVISTSNCMVTRISRAIKGRSRIGALRLLPTHNKFLMPAALGICRKTKLAPMQNREGKMQTTHAKASSPKHDDWYDMLINAKRLDNTKFGEPKTIERQVSELFDELLEKFQLTVPQLVTKIGREGIKVLIDFCYKQALAQRELYKELFFAYEKNLRLRNKLETPKAKNNKGLGLGVAAATIAATVATISYLIQAENVSSAIGNIVPPTLPSEESDIACTEKIHKNTGTGVLGPWECYMRGDYTCHKYLNSGKVDCTKNIYSTDGIITLEKIFSGKFYSLERAYEEQQKKQKLAQKPQVSCAAAAAAGQK